MFIAIALMMFARDQNKKEGNKTRLRHIRFEILLH
jgi:hypothetical protein